MISYRKLRIYLMDNGLKITNVCKSAGVSISVSTKINNDESIELKTLEKICLYLGVNIGEICDILPN